MGYGLPELCQSQPFNNYCAYKHKCQAENTSERDQKDPNSLWVNCKTKAKKCTEATTVQLRTQT